MTIKLVAFDMDGTFLNDQNTYNHQRYGALLPKLRQRGIRVVAASGSQYQRLQTQFGAFQDQMDFVSQNGAVVHSDGQLLRVTAMPASAVRTTLVAIARAFTASEVAEHLVVGVKSAYVDQLISDASWQQTYHYYDHLQRVPNLAGVTAARLNDQITSIGITFAEQVNFQRALTRLRPQLPAGVTSQTSGYQTELISAATVNKGAGIRELQNKYGIADDELMTFGDNENDLSMLTVTPHAYAMANAVEHVKARVPHQTTSNNAEGVLDVLSRLV
ncbi:HAD family phosphatase [Lactiplantibacillus garii]|uniref:HAD family phosphatase n=1 Tax=Lactiplantibacillus garii TaxID=2306423 RepID=A0A426DAY1_9LACO|nr:HAD family hydrolase [Lactiplantibacillus garii]RRK11701.1 HAD family phosphatase [Lactiplantibacillus garii]